MDLTGLTRGEAEELMAELGQPGYRGRQIFQWVQARRVTTVEAMTSLARTLRAELAAHATVSRPGWQSSSGQATDAEVLAATGGRPGDRERPDPRRRSADRLHLHPGGLPLGLPLLSHRPDGRAAHLTAAEIVGESCSSRRRWSPASDSPISS